MNAKVDELQILRPAEVASLLGVSISSLNAMIREGIFTPPKVRIGKNAVGYRIADIARWIDSRTDIENLVASRAVPC